jgi:hypothetical protein
MAGPALCLEEPEIELSRLAPSQTMKREQQSATALKLWQRVDAFEDEGCGEQREVYQS